MIYFYVSFPILLTCAEVDFGSGTRYTFEFDIFFGNTQNTQSLILNEFSVKSTDAGITIYSISFICLSNLSGFGRLVQMFTSRRSLDN